MNDLSISAASDFTPREHIENKTRGEIEAYIASRGKTRVHQGARNLSLNVSDDYGNRFLIELIQNAHDAHPADRCDGEISIVLDPEEGAHGCLYVANRGEEFKHKNFESITNIALSSKPVNESIGNKGLGFRSVLQICRWPEIYSGNSSKDGQSFEGYSFKFASESDLINIASEMEHASLGSEIWENMPCWFLPVVAKERPGLINRFAKDGFASVVRMPLESDEARSAVISQFDWLLGLETPLHLFLDRIACISIERESKVVERLERETLSKWLPRPGCEILRLKVGGDEFLVASMNVDQEEFRVALNDSLSKKQVPSSWKDWQGAARVSVAIRLDRSVEKGVMYCFLPLGSEGRSPFAGYINANFYTKMDRRSIDGAITLNRFFIRSSAMLCKYAIDFLIDKNWPQSPGGVVDLLCWNSQYANDLVKAFEENEGCITSNPLLPIWSPDQKVRWSSADDTFIWDVASDACLSIQAIANSTGTAFLSAELSKKQRDSIKEFFISTNTFEPTEETISNWIESVAKKMHEEQARPEQWAALYDEVAVHLRSSPEVLIGKKFLLSSTGALIASEISPDQKVRRRPADIYFPPGGARDSDDEPDDDESAALPLEKMPASLRRGFAFLSNEVPWLNKEGGYRPARAFFLDAKLVREYDTRDVLRTLASITRSDVADSTKQAALEWSFRLWTSGRSLSEKETRGAHFSLPTKSGWKSAEVVMFCSGWDTLNGKSLERMLKLGEGISPSLASIRANSLVSYRDWPIKVGAQEDWQKFLMATGARDCLRPISGEKIQKEVIGYLLKSTILSGTFLDNGCKEIWLKCLAPRNDAIRNPNTTYRCDVTPWHFPGQEDSLTFPDTLLRRDYAYQILVAIPHLDKDHFLFRIHRPSRYGTDRNEEYWPTPLRAYLEKAEWIPVQRVGGDIMFVAPENAWLASSEYDARPPRFIDLIPPSIARNPEGGLAWLKQNVGLGVLDDSKHAARALSVLSEAASEQIEDDVDVRRFRELFSQAWNSAISENSLIELAWLPVYMGSTIKAMALTDDSDEYDVSDVVYFADEESDLKKQLLGELEEKVFDFEFYDVETTWNLLNQLAPNRVRRLSEQPLEVHVDGHRFDFTSDTPLLRDVFGEWIIDFLVCAAERKGGPFFVRTQKALGNLKHSVEALRFAMGHTLQISMDGNVKNLPLSARGAVTLSHGSITTLVVESAEGEPSLGLLARISEQLAIALNQKELANGFDAALLRLAIIHGDDLLKPEDAEIAEALGVGIELLVETRRYVQSDLSSQIEFAQPLAAYLGLNQSVEDLRILSDDNDLSEELVLKVLKPIALVLGMSERQLVDQLGLVSDILELKNQFSLNLLKLNSVLRQLGSRFQPINNKDLHVRIFRSYLANHNLRIVDQIRVRFLNVFDEYQDLSLYVQLREATMTIEADPEWHESMDDLPDEIMSKQVHNWLLSHGVSPVGVSHTLTTLTECRDNNARLLREFTKQYSLIVSAWAGLNQDGTSDELRALWLEPGTSKLEMIQHAYASGWSDFRLLDDSMVAKWLEQSMLWPKGMPSSTKFSDWNLPENAIDKAQKDAELDREARRKERTEISFGGQKLSALKGDYQALMDAIKGRFSEAVDFLDVDASFRTLNDILDPPGGSGGSGSRSGFSGGKSPDTAMSDEQKGAIGFIGERWAFEWIKAFHQKRHNRQLEDNCWVSGYRNIVLGGKYGRDDLGYDFEVKLSSVTYYYEVKASSGDPSFFELGPTEIGAALRYKADKDNKYRILYIANVTDPQRVCATVLHNPFSREGEKKLRAIGRGSVKYTFDVLND